MFDLGKVLKGIFGKDVQEMDNRELAEKVQAIREEGREEQAEKHRLPDTSAFDRLVALPEKKWMEKGVGYVRFVPSSSEAVPCELCAPLLGKVADSMNAVDDIAHARKEHRDPFCLAIVPAYRVDYGTEDDCPLPALPAGEKALHYSVLVKWVDDIYERDHAPSTRERTGAFDFEAHILDQATAAAGGYAEYSPYGLLSCIRTTAAESDEGADLTWMLPLIDQVAKEAARTPNGQAQLEKLRGELLLQAGRKAEALAAFNRAVELYPGIGLKRKAKALEKELEGQDHAGI